MVRRQPIFVAGFVVAALFLIAALVPGPYAGNTMKAPQRPSGEVIVPGAFLRLWDPVTIFFDSDRGPGSDVAAHDAERFVTLSPAHPGAWRWLDKRTLQFRPAEPWPPLASFDWGVGGKTYTLETLVSPVTWSRPASNANGLGPVESVQLRFRQPVDAKALEDMVTIALRPLPGTDPDPIRVLTKRDFDIKTLARKTRDEEATYDFQLHTPIPEGMVAQVSLRLAASDRNEKSVQRIRFSTAPRFEVLQMGCAGTSLPSTRDGAAYAKDKAIVCRGQNRRVEIAFSAQIPAIDPVLGRNLVRFEPTVKDLTYEASGKRLYVKGDFQAETLYRVSVHPDGLQDTGGRAIATNGVNSLFLHFPRKADFLTVGTGEAIVERLGPQMLPISARGQERLDVRIHAIEPLDLAFWPFSAKAVSVNDDAMPPGPGEEANIPLRRRINPSELAAQILQLGSPSLSHIVRLPLKRDDGAATFGLDLKNHLARVAGANQPGTYLVGLRRLDAGSQRDWIRVQVTDLSLSVIEEETTVRFSVTSLNSARPVSNATVTVEGRAYGTGKLVTLAEGRTDGAGTYVWRPLDTIDTPSAERNKARRPIPERLIVRKGKDTLVVDVLNPPKVYKGHTGFAGIGNWLRWTATKRQVEERAQKPETLCHLFTDRPIYRPDEGVHIKGYLRTSHRGAYSIDTKQVAVTVTGPDGSEWRYDLPVSENGSFYKLFDEETDATGYYEVRVAPQGENTCSDVEVQKEAYRLPRFEVRLDAPRRTSLDTAFDVALSAEYYAGGMVAKRPVEWRITKFPYNWTPAKRDGFIYSTDARFSDTGRDDRSESVVTQIGETDAEGRAVLTIDPTTEPTARPRAYIIEATVTGDDDQTVTDVADVKVLPAFALGLKAPRYLNRSSAVRAEILAAGPDDKLIAGKKVRVRLIKRRWSAILQTSDFTTGAAKYRTEVLDETVAERTIESGAAPVAIEMPLTGTGVYILDIESQDALGRSQSVKLDFFNDDETPASWSKPVAETFDVAMDKASYAPGETARLILQSPFQTAQALAIVEHPDGRNRYQWLPVRGGKAVFSLRIERSFLPEIPVHFMLIRGRIAGADPRADIDLGKPATLAASRRVQVTPVDHRVTIDLKYPEKAQPGDEIEVDIALKDLNGSARSGEVVLWLVDQAVLALGQEADLDPLEDFLLGGGMRMELRDTRNLTMGYLPFQKQPGGDAEEDKIVVSGSRARRMGFLDAAPAPAQESLLNQATVRKTFLTVPYFNPTITVGRNGRATVKVKLPDNLTDFAIRAKAVSGTDRFGFAKGKINVRLPVIVQPTLPRFVRYGDRFVLSALSRIVEGDAGRGRAELETQGLSVEGDGRIGFDWDETKTKRLRYQVRVPVPSDMPATPDDTPKAKITFGVERVSDRARDAFQVDLPVLRDRRPVKRRRLATLRRGESVSLDGLEDAVRPGTLRRTVLLSSEPAFVRMSSGLSYLLGYPHGCAEQRIGLARGLVGARRFMSLAMPDVNTARIDRHVSGTLTFLSEVTNDAGYVSYWPGSRAYVPLTAWAYLFMLQAEEAGYEIDTGLSDRMAEALRRSLRGDYQNYLDEYGDRTWALAALAAAGNIEGGYVAELARKSEFLTQESLAHVTWALARSQDRDSSILTRLEKELWDGLVFKLEQGRETYAGLRDRGTALSPIILPTETRTIAQTLRAVSAIPDRAERERMLASVLVRLGKGDGWGTTNANTEAVLALHDYILSGDAPAFPARTISADLEPQSRSVSVGGKTALARLSLDGNSDGIRLASSDLGDGEEVAVLERVQYVPAESGAKAAASASGFVVERTLIHVGDATRADKQIPLDAAGKSIHFTVGDVIEDRARVVNPSDRNHVAIILPLAAGMEPLNPALDTAPPEAKPTGPITAKPSYVAYLDDRVAFFYETLPRGTYAFAFRTRAQVEGVFSQPPAFAEMMYEETTNGQSHGAEIAISRPDTED